MQRRAALGIFPTRHGHAYILGTTLGHQLKTPKAQTWLATWRRPLLCNGTHDEAKLKCAPTTN
ncbi:hypothetical protein IF2G_04578 [Cordyceps javanica]|nr:hypothetical protein IF2G_04578 [Cordyceps javanica]